MGSSCPLTCSANRSAPRPSSRAARLTPSPRSLPSPSRRPIRWTSWTTASALPHVSSTPPVIPGGDDPVLVALHRERDHRARRDRVEHVLGVQLVDQRERVQIAHDAEGPGGRERLVLGPAVLRRDAELLHLDLALARDGAGVTGAAVDQNGIAHRLAADGARPLERAVAEVARGQDAARLERQHGAGGAELVEAVLGAVVVFLEPDELALRLFLVRRGGGPPAARARRLEVLRAHHGAEAAAAVEVLELVHDRPEPHTPPARDSGLQHADPLVAELGLEAVLDLTRELSPGRLGVPELDLAVFDPKVRRLLGPAADRHAVEPRCAQLGPPPAARLGL